MQTKEKKKVEEWGLSFFMVCAGSFLIYLFLWTTEWMHSFLPIVYTIFITLKIGIGFDRGKKKKKFWITGGCYVRLDSSLYT